jgi:hypothetical protein
MLRSAGHFVKKPYTRHVGNIVSLLVRNVLLKLRCYNVNLTSRPADGQAAPVRRSLDALHSSLCNKGSFFVLYWMTHYWQPKLNFQMKQMSVLMLAVLCATLWSSLASDESPPAVCRDSSECGLNQCCLLGKWTWQYRQNSTHFVSIGYGCWKSTAHRAEICKCGVNSVKKEYEGEKNGDEKEAEKE